MIHCLEFLTHNNFYFSKWNSLNTYFKASYTVQKKNETIQVDSHFEKVNTHFGNKNIFEFVVRRS